ncbi:MAG: ATP-binding protein [Clostridia bacterium]|nr:ATP-binding protein [Clostridia bacterium]
MGTKKNNRSLKKRISRATFLSIFLTVFIFGGALTLLTISGLNHYLGQIPQDFSNSIAESINSKNFLSYMELDDLKDFNPDSPKAKRWISSIKNLKESRDVFKWSAKPDSNIPNPDIKEPHLPSVKLDGNELISTLLANGMLHVTIDIENKIVYSGSGSDKILFIFDSPDSVPFFNEAVQAVTKHFNSEGSSQLYNSTGDVIGNVTVKINPNMLLNILIILLLGIYVAGFLSFSITYFVSRFFTKPIIEPLNTLNEKMRAIAVGNYETTINSQIIIKKPLREIESLADSANMIMKKMNEYNKLLSEQKQVLENQNAELEAQNEELVSSRRQIQDAQTLLVQSEKMASIGQLTAAITHEINTPLGAINSNVQMIDMFLSMLSMHSKIQSDDELSNLVEQMKETNSINIMACQRVSEIIKSLKNFSRLDHAEFQEYNINEGVKSVLILTSNLWKKKISIHEQYGELPTVKCFPGLMNQVFMNIVVNAIQAIDEKGEIFIRTYMDDKYVYASFRDTGSGIREENLSKIFEPGFTTKHSCNCIGMGLGLSICTNIIAKHNGEIRVQSEVGRGTEFTVCIPVHPIEAPNCNMVTQNL